jgi:epoxyqueuosine reductase
MNKSALREMAVEFINQSQGNVILERSAISSDMVGLRLFAEPIVGFASAGDPLFSRMQDMGVVGPHFALPDYWVPGPRRLYLSSCLFPSLCDQEMQQRQSGPPQNGYTAGSKDRCSLTLWRNTLCDRLNAAGYTSLAPSLDDRFFSRGKTSIDEVPFFTSSWSERHVAFVCGLGTFGLSKGLITERGVAGRFGSIVTTLDLEPDSRAYSEPYEYCSFCGDCITNCPVEAITLERGKDHLICSDFLDVVKKRFSPRYGCGKCQVGVACETGIPKRQ